jgi:NitT/TauT family transport system substrate-binding protein
MKRKSAIGLLAGAAFATAGAARADDAAVITVASTPSADAVPFFYALSAGLFDRAGLTVKPLSLSNGAAIAAAVAGGVADVGFSNLQTLIAAHAKGIPFVILAPGGEYNDATPTTQLLVRSDSAIRTAKDLEGRIVVVGALHDLQSLTTMAWMAAGGADPTKVSFIESPASAALALLQQQRADAIVVSEPNLHNALRSGTARVLGNPYAALAPRLPVSAWSTTRAFLTAHPDTAKRFSDVMKRASDYANGHAADLAPLISDYTKLSLATLHDMNHAMQATTMDLAGLQLIIDASATYHLIDKPFAAKDLMGA